MLISDGLILAVGPADIVAPQAPPDTATIDLGGYHMEHAEFLDPDHEMRFDPDLAEKMAECGIWISPTLQAWTNYGRIVELEQKRDQGELSATAENQLQALSNRAEKRLDIMRRMLDYCRIDRIVPGTDSGVGSLALGHLD